MPGFSVMGGARIGSVNASWPFARLAVVGDRLTISVFLLGQYDFKGFQILSIEPCEAGPILSSGLRIHHTHPDYPESIIFWTLGDRDRLFDRIRLAGLYAAEETPAIALGQGFPLRWRAVAILLIAWNAPFLIDHLVSGVLRARAGPISLIPFGGAFILSWLALHSRAAQDFLLKDGHSVREIKPALQVARFVFGLIFFSLLTYLITDAIL